MITVLVIEPNGSIRKTQTALDLDAFRGLLNGGYLEPIGEAGRWFAYLDEEGKIKGLQMNMVATNLARALGWPAGDILVGPVVFMGPASPEGDETDVPDFVVAKAAEVAGLA